MSDNTLWGRRQLIAAGVGAASLLGRPAPGRTAAAPVHGFPKDFLWGAATSGHQTEGNNVNSDTWAIEHAKPTVFAEVSGDACNSFHLWPKDLDIVRSLGLNAYRFSLEWARIEPAQGEFSPAMLHHYSRMIDGCTSGASLPSSHLITSRKQTWDLRDCIS
jgi:beta-glucosidase